MQDYKEMYLKLFGAVEDAINLLISAQQECEELYISSPEQTEKVIPDMQEQAKTASGE